jgi:hypothetical protein
LHSPNLIKKGDGPESKKRMPDKSDGYPIDSRSRAYARLLALGFSRITFRDICRIGNALEEWCAVGQIPLTARNRAARRRKPNAFYWMDENWTRIQGQMYDMAVLSVLGRPSIAGWPSRG